ncbi:hypothetical protein F5Y06DRAFT_300175 [Hypoxylon sp. FL0890]|nr:hypothetical protein F5Y06DRAFT_300175 [Hypoxylon sp. FL0890]
MAPHKKKKHQARLTFEPVGSSNTSDHSSPAKIRFAKGAGANSTSRPRTAASPTKPPAASFMPGRHGSRRPPVGGDSSDEAEENEDEDDIPLRSSQSVSTKLRRTILSDENDKNDDDDAPIIPHSTAKRQRPPIITLDDDDEDEDEDEDDDEPIVVPGSSKRRRPKFVELEDSSDGVTSPMKKRKTSLITPGQLKKPAQVASSSTKRGRPKSHRSEKQKKLELLRRRRNGEMIDKVTSSEEDSDEERRGIYDSDSDQELLVLREFDDEEPDEEEEKVPARQPSRKGKQSKPREGDDDELDDFIIDDDDAPLGAPANLDIPLEFTAQAHRPLKHQFPFVIEWLVHNRINPAFERKDPVYANAWRKLDDEVRTLASSKFASSAWKSEFYRALKGRPKMESYEIEGAERGADICEACGRSSHPATFKVFFRGHPYYKDTLAEVESDSSDSNSEDSDGDESGHESVDSQGLALPPQTKAWHVGVVCCGNAETAHGLIHWKHALKEWVEDQLEQDGWMDAKKLKERERMKARKRRDLANKITDAWREKNIIASLYRDFKNTLEEARNKSTTARNRGRFG